MKKFVTALALLMTGFIPLQGQASSTAKKSMKAKAANELDALNLPEKFKVLPVRDDLSPRIKKLVWIYMRQGHPAVAEAADIKREEDYLAHYKDKTYVRFMLVRELREKVSRNAEGFEEAKKSGASQEELEGRKASLDTLRNRLSIAESWKP